LSRKIEIVRKTGIDPFAGLFRLPWKLQTDLLRALAVRPEVPVLLSTGYSHLVNAFCEGCRNKRIRYEADDEGGAREGCQEK